MSQISSDSHIRRRAELTASIAAGAALKRIRNDTAAEREYHILANRVAHEFDDAFGPRGILKRALAKINDHGFPVPAERKRDLIASTSGRSFHAQGTTHRTKRGANGTKAGKRARSSGAAHYRYIEDGDHDASIAAASTGSHAGYIDGSRVESTADGERYSASNITGGFVERMRFFALAEQFERQSHGDKVSIDINRTSDAWAAALTDPACDPAVQAAVEQHQLPHKGGPVKINLEGGAEDLRILMTKHGFELSKASTNKERLRDDGIAFHRGRAGRTHFRWVFEVPKEFSARQRNQLLKAIGGHMEQLGCMYAAVIHAPDPHNDETNHHVHLIFYDRRCRRLTGTDRDLSNVGKEFKSAIRAEIAAGQIKPGEWDLTVARTYKSNRSWKTHFPFRAEKSRAVTKGKDFKKRFRVEFAAIVNKISTRAGGPTIYDPRSYTDRDVDLTPSKKLHSHLHSAEVAGIPTLIGIDNESNQASDARRSIVAQYEAEASRLASLNRSLAPFMAGDVHPRVTNWARGPVNNIEDARAALEARYAIEMWLLETARERSRAVLVRDRQRRAAEKGPAQERRDRGLLADAAEAHLLKLDEQDAEMQRAIAAMERDLVGTPVVTDESIERTVLNCQVLRRDHPMVADREGVRKLDVQIMVKSEKGALSGRGEQVIPSSAPGNPHVLSVKAIERNQNSIDGRITVAVQNDHVYSASPAESRHQPDEVKQTVSSSVHQRAVVETPKASEKGIAASLVPPLSAPLVVPPLVVPPLIVPPLIVPPLVVPPLVARGAASLPLIVPPLIAPQTAAVMSALLENGEPLRAHPHARTDHQKSDRDEVSRDANFPLRPVGDREEPRLHATELEEVPDQIKKPVIVTPQSEPVRTTRVFSAECARLLAEGPTPEANIALTEGGKRPEDFRSAEGGHRGLDDQEGVGEHVDRQASKTATSQKDASFGNDRDRPGLLPIYDVSVSAALEVFGGSEQLHRPSADTAQVDDAAVGVEGKTIQTVDTTGDPGYVFAASLEARHVRLVELDGQIAVAAFETLSPEDAIMIATSQAALRAVKVRQDLLAIEVAKVLMLNAESLAAGKIEAVDKRTIALKDKWAGDPAIAGAVKRIRGESPAPAASLSPHKAAAFHARQGQGMG